MGTWPGNGFWNPRKSSIRLKSRSMRGLAHVNGIFGEVSGNGTLSADGEVSGTVTVAAASIDTKNPGVMRTCALVTSSTAATIRTSPSPRTVSGRLVRVSP